MDQALAFSLVIGGFSASLIAVANSPIGKFLKRSIKRDMEGLMLAASKEANIPLGDQLSKLDSYTRYHLGPNGSTPALHDRMKNVEESAGKLSEFISYQHDRNHDLMNKILAAMGRTAQLEESVKEYVEEDNAMHQSMLARLNNIELFLLNSESRAKIIAKNLEEENIKIEQVAEELKAYNSTPKYFAGEVTIEPPAE